MRLSTSLFFAFSRESYFVYFTLSPQKRTRTIIWTPETMSQKTAKTTKAPAAAAPTTTTTTTTATTTEKGNGERKVVGVNKKRNYDRYSTYIHRLLKQINQETKINRDAMTNLNSAVKDIMNRICKESKNLLDLSKHKTLSLADASTAVDLVLENELSQFARKQGDKALTKYRSSVSGAKTEGESKDKKESKQARAGLVLPVSRVKTYLKEKCGISGKIQTEVPIYVTAVVEYLISEVLELSSLASVSEKKKTISPKHIRIALEGDEDLHALFHAAMLSKAGVQEQIAPELLVRKPKSKKSKKASATTPKPKKAASAEPPKKKAKVSPSNNGEEKPKKKASSGGKKTPAKKAASPGAESTAAAPKKGKKAAAVAKSKPGKKKAATTTEDVAQE